jgi:hypothetical protein
LDERRLGKFEELENHIKTLFDPSEFHWRGILQPPERWEKFVRDRGQYVFDLRLIKN